jgi:hypothetical protein
MPLVLYGFERLSVILRENGAEENIWTEERVEETA